ncbi:MAG: hypothetical protein CL816_00620 [Coxiellaceae bacterium]|nr:hypothetical protein [Coxiellaceae bacterium]
MKKIIIILLASLTTLCLSSCQSVSSNDTATLLNGIYSDPNHPSGSRQVIAHHNQLTIKGRDDINDNIWVVNGIIQGNIIKLDFSSKGGPASITATFNNHEIIFSDGNSWVKQPKHQKIT